MTDPHLPRVIEVLEVIDCGPGPSVSCPHCGADGRYITRFRCDDGTTRGAMSGCFKLFPAHRFCLRVDEIKRREIEAERQGRRLASWDQAILDAIRAFASGERSEAEVDRVIKIEDARKKSWCKSRARGGRRR